MERFSITLGSFRVVAELAVRSAQARRAQHEEEQGRTLQATCFGYTSTREPRPALGDAVCGWDWDGFSSCVAVMRMRACELSQKVKQKTQVELVKAG